MPAVDTVNESLTTVDDGDTTVNERLSPGGKGPEGQPDTAKESLSAPVEPTPVEEAPAEGTPAEKPKRKRS